MSQRTKLIPGQWYRLNGHHGCDQIVFLIGFRRNGLAICEVDECATSAVYVDKNEWEHLPDCDSFDWQPEAFPQWYVCGNNHGWGITAYVVRDTSKTYFCVEANGETKESADYTWDQELVTCGFWKQVTQAEAESRVNKPEPVESPEDWVTQDRVGARPGIDERRFTALVTGQVQPWNEVKTSWSAGMMHGDERGGEKIEVRCRRRNLPPMPHETPKREYVRCFASFGTCKLYAANARFAPEDAELKHDGTGFYLEDSK